MKRCDSCKNPDGTLFHPTTASCHWLDGDLICDHCGGELVWFRGSALGDWFDEMSMGADI